MLQIGSGVGGTLACIVQKCTLSLAWFHTSVWPFFYCVSLYGRQGFFC